MARLREILRTLESERSFFTMGTFENVRVKIPKLQPHKVLPASIIKLDGKAVEDIEHYYDGVPLVSGIIVNRHYYFFQPHELVAGKIVVARVTAVLEKLDSGRSYVRLNIEKYLGGNHRPQYEIKFSSNGEEGNNVVAVAGGSEKIVFKPIVV